VKLAPPNHERDGLSLSAQQILDHWEQFDPKMVAGLRAEGKLREVLQSVDDQTSRAYSDLIDKGLSVDQAEEITREMWMVPSPPLSDLRDPDDPPTPARA
jgi:hypothetical protein